MYLWCISFFYFFFYFFLFSTFFFVFFLNFFFFKQRTESEMRISDWSSDVCSSDLLLERNGLSGRDVHVIGYHGQTIAHRPDRGWTWQIGDGQALADALGVAVVDDFRTADVAAGGQGAPLVPVYHAARLGGGSLPAVVQIGRAHV